MLCFTVLSCSGIFNKSKTKVSVGDVILTNGYRVPVEFVESINWAYIGYDVVGIVCNILEEGSYMVICPKPNAVIGDWHHNETTWVHCFYDEIAECMVPSYDVPYLWKIDTGAPCGIDNWDVIKAELYLLEDDISLFPIFEKMKGFNEFMYANYKYFNSGWYVPTWNEVNQIDVDIINNVYNTIYNGSFSGSYWLANSDAYNCASYFEVNYSFGNGEPFYFSTLNYDSVTNAHSFIFVRNFNDLDESKIYISEYQHLEE